MSRATSVVIYENPGGQTEPGDDPSSDESEDLARTVSSEVSRTEHVFVTNEDEISPKEAIAKLKKNTEERLDKMMEIIEAMRALICSKDKAEQRDPQKSDKIGETSNPQKNMTEGQSSRHEEIRQSEDDQVALLIGRRDLQQTLSQLNEESKMQQKGIFAPYP